MKQAFVPKRVFDARTGKPVLVIAEIPGNRLLLTGTDNRHLTKKQRTVMALKIIELCREHGVFPGRLAIALCAMGDTMLEIEQKEGALKHGR